MGFGFQLYSFSAFFCPARTHGWTVWLASMEEPRNKRRAIDRIGQRDNVRSKTRSYCFRQPVIHSAKRHPGEKHLHAKRCSIATLTFPRRSRPNCGGCKRIFKRQSTKIIILLSSNPMLPQSWLRSILRTCRNRVSDTSVILF